MKTYFKEKFEVSVCCPRCRQYHSVYVERSDYWKWMRSHTHIQQVFSYLNASEREILLTGTCSACWEEMFKDE